jgi:hypothetical protein
MSRFNSTVLLAAGALCVGIGTHNFVSKYSDQAIFQRQRGVIEKVYAREARAPGRDAAKKAEERRAQRYGELRSGLAELNERDVPSAGEHCRFEARFEKRLRTGSADAAAEEISREGIKPFEQCTLEGRAKEKDVSTFMVIGVPLFLLGGVGLLRSFGKDKGEKERIQRSRLLEGNRRKALMDFGIEPGNAARIAKASLATLSTYDTFSANTGAAQVLSALEIYGFTRTEIEAILLVVPKLLNDNTTELSQTLIGMENDGRRSQSEVISDVVRLPGLLG